MVDIVPIKVEELLKLTNIGVSAANIQPNNLTMESDRFICVRQGTPTQSEVVLVDMSDPTHPLRKPSMADSVIMNPSNNAIALRSQRLIQVFSVTTKTKLREHTMPLQEKIVFWKWISVNVIALVTQKAVYHWGMNGNMLPVKQFERHGSLSNYAINNYIVDHTKQCLLLMGTIGDGFEVGGKMQLYSVDRDGSQVFDGHAAAFGQFKMEGNLETSTLLCFAVSLQPRSKLTIVEPGAGQIPLGNRRIPKKEVYINFPPENSRDFPAAMQTCSKHGLVYLITKCGYVHLYDIESGLFIYMSRVSGPCIFVTAINQSKGGFVGVNQRGQVISVSVNNDLIIPYIDTVLRNPELSKKMTERIEHARGFEDCTGFKFTHAAGRPLESQQRQKRELESSSSMTDDAAQMSEADQMSLAVQMSLVQMRRQASAQATPATTQTGEADRQTRQIRRASSTHKEYDCVVCLDRPVDSVLYTCGHMCMCFECAQQLHWGIAQSHCPICRAVVIDVIKTFRP